MKRTLPRVVAFAMMLALSAGSWAECAGWQVTPEARVACCAAGDDCPMHRSAAQDSGSTATVSQAEADSCCASSETNQRRFSVAIAMALPPAPLVHRLFAPAPPSALALDPAGQSIPLGGSPVPKHLLLSVFLI